MVRRHREENGGRLPSLEADAETVWCKMMNEEYLGREGVERQRGKTHCHAGLAKLGQTSGPFGATISYQSCLSCLRPKRWALSPGPAQSPNVGCLGVTMGIAALGS